MTEDLKSTLNLLYFRLSEIEKEIVRAISQLEEPFSKENLKNILSLSTMNIINGLQSLMRRCLLEKNIENPKLFHLLSVFREYVKIYHLPYT